MLDGGRCVRFSTVGVNSDHRQISMKLGHFVTLTKCLSLFYNEQRRDKGVFIKA